MEQLIWMVSSLVQGQVVGEIMGSPFIVPVAGTIMILGIVVVNTWSRVRTREMQSQERLAAIAKGLPLPAEPPQPARLGRVRHQVDLPPGALNDGSNARRAGIVLVSIGISLMAFFVCLAMIIHVTEVLIPAAAGLIPAAIGVGFLVDARMRHREYERRLLAGWPVTGAPAEPRQDRFTAAPPPPLYAGPPGSADVPRAANGEPETTTLKPYEQQA